MHVAALIVAVVFYGDKLEGTRSLQTVRDIVSNPERLALAIKLLVESKLCGGLLARMGGQLTYFIDREKSSTLTTVSRHLRFLDSPAVAESTRTSSFDPAILRSGKASIYLILPPTHMRTLSPLLRLWIITMFRAVISGGLQERNKVHFILDEASSLGKFEAIEDAVDKYRGYGIRLFFCYQSLGQLKKCFPEGGDQTLLSNCTQIFFGVNDQGLAGGTGTGDYVSARLGEETLIVRSGGTSTGRSGQWSSSSNGQSSGGGWSDNASRSWQQQPRKLLKPEEVVALDPRIAITFTPGVPPICTKLLRYYEEKNLGIPPSRFGQAVAAMGTLTLALVAFVLAIALAGRVSQMALEEQAVRHRLHHHIQKHRPDVPVDWQSVSPRE